MQTNPCYGDHTLPVYEELQLQDKAPEPTDVRVKQNKRISSSFANKTETKCIAVVVVLSLLTIAMVVAIALFASVRVDSNQDMDSLMEEIQELKMQLNETKESSDEYCKIENGPHTNRNWWFDATELGWYSK